METFDYAIIGAGAAGLHLALAMQRDPFFASKKLLILDKDAKDQNDRTWCYWEKGEGLWDHLIRKQWHLGDFYHKDAHISLELTPYRYKMLRGIDFYRHGKQMLANTPGIRWVQDEVVDLAYGEVVDIKGQKNQYQARQVFDSRIPEAFTTGKDRHTRLLQHFKGWMVRTPEDRFNPERFTMMDYRLLWEGASSFTYVLPINAREALVEFTLFSGALLEEADYDRMLQRYMAEILNIDTFEVVETEKGIIPMTDFPFEAYSVDQHLRIGTGGGWVKPSTGYSFKNSEKNAARVVQNLKAGKPAGNGLISAKFRWYDAIFLDVLDRHNADGPELFYTMYRKNPIQRIFAFLDDESTLAEDLQIINGFPKAPFVRSFFRKNLGI